MPDHAPRAASSAPDRASRVTSSAPDHASGTTYSAPDHASWAAASAPEHTPRAASSALDHASGTTSSAPDHASGIAASPTPGPTPGPGPGLAPAKVLRLADFMPDPPDDAPMRVSGIGLLTGERYLVPAEVVWTGEAASRVEPTLVGLVSNRPDGISVAIADLLAHDIVTRWWVNPRMPLLRMSRRVPSLLPPGMAQALALMRLRVSAFVLPAPDFPIALVGVSGDGTTIATAAARTVGAAVSEAFLRAMAARAQPWHTLPTADSLRRLTVWHREADYLAHLDRSAVDPAPTLVEDSAPLGWADIACRRFGHEPILIGQSLSTPIKIVCPGAACHHTTPAGTPLPCPVP
ncbi:hypothetical protein [Sphaerisporangium aureirubrum]|uniref:YcaO domain-containing protein n=1 Tax=Sphaerisporangium aureirubrum TaxID=1544736 RepID=A0ABW1NGF7_9ACTN